MHAFFTHFALSLSLTDTHTHTRTYTHNHTHTHTHARTHTHTLVQVLHLHLSDSQSIPFQFESLPAVSSAAPYSADEVYTATDMMLLVEYARVRGVRVIPEIDGPGHARAWGLAYGYNNVIACGEVEGKDYATYCATPPCGQLNPAAPNNLTYNMIESATRDIAAAFAGERIHLGYDEVNFACWESDATASAYMAHTNIDAASLLREYYTEQRRRFDSSAAPGRKTVFWEEVALQGLPLREDDLVQVWSNRDALRAVMDRSSASVIVSWADHYYLDCGRGNMFGAKSWCDPYKTAVDM
jgi:hexosaminidase